MQEFDLFVPGRVCLFGEHSDWAGGYRRLDSSIPMGYCLIVGTNQGIYAKVKPNSDELIMTSTLPDGQRIPNRIKMDEKILFDTAKRGGFFSYIAGVAYYVLRNYHVKGLTIDSYKMDLPIRKGLSSSAAINVLTARAFNYIYDLKLTKRGEMELAYLGEILTPSRCGRMDQACAYGRVPVFLTFDGDNMEIEELHPQRPIYMVIVDLKKGKDTKQILADLNACYPNTKGKIAEDVRYYLGHINQEILIQAKQAIIDGDAEEVGRLMTEAQRLFDEFMIPASPRELTAPKLHQVLSYPPIQDLIWGGKGVGSQGDGCAQFVVRGPQEQKELIKKLPESLDVECFELTIEPK
ncbi:MAG: GHMP kinase [bacterium]|nr:GHMP kinase [bacterium]